MLIVGVWYAPCLVKMAMFIIKGVMLLILQVVIVVRGHIIKDRAQLVSSYGIKTV